MTDEKRIEEFNKSGYKLDNVSAQRTDRVSLLDPADFAAELADQIAGINAHLEKVNETCIDLQNRLDLMHNTVTSGISSMKVDEDGNLESVQWADEMRHMLGYEDENDLPNTIESWKQAVPEDTKAGFVNLFYNVESMTPDSNIVHAQYPMQSKNGEIRWYDSVSRLVKREDGSLREILAAWRDITAEHDKDVYIEQVQAVSKVFDFCYYIHMEDHSYVVVRNNERADSAGIVVKKNPFENLHRFASLMVGADRQADVQAFIDPDTLQERLAATGVDTMEIYSPYLEDWYRLCFIGGKRNDDGEYADVVFGTTNISADKAKEEKYQRELEDQFAIINALSSNFTNIYTANLNDGTAKAIRLAADYGYEEIAALKNKAFPFEAIIAHWAEHEVHPDDIDRLCKALSLENLREVMATQDGLVGTYRSAPSRGQHTFRYDVRKVDDYGNLVAGFQLIDSIIEEEREQQEQLSNALAVAQQANKAKSTFLNSMSHDIRTPMNAIIGFTALAQTHIDDQAQVKDYLAKISTSSTHLLSLINDILDMSRIESGTVKLDEKPVHIPDLLHDLRTMIQGLVSSKSQNLYIDTQDIHHEDVITDKLRLNQVLINIVGNAIKFTQPGGDIIIRLVEKPCSIKDHATYEFTVKDNGIGMSEEFVEHIFDTFSREYSATVSGVQGTGLGMAITKNIVDMMGGEIEVKSRAEKGSVFTVTLSLKLANAPVKNEPIPDLMGARALVVDDDLNTCRSVSKMLREIKMRPDWTASGKEAIVRAHDAAEMKDEYKVYIIDYLMPDMNGIEVVRRIRKIISEDVPIIVLTAYDWGDFEHEAREAGVTAFVSKPIFMSELRAVLTQPVSYDEADSHAGARSYNYTGKHVLLVEDNALNCEIATAILEQTGMTVDSVDDGDVAVETIENAPAGKYDLIMMDIQMPKMDGYTATREIRTLPDNDKANIPIVAMTANAFEEDRQKAFQAGMNGHIIKPISIDEIAKVLDGIFFE